MSNDNYFTVMTKFLENWYLNAIIAVAAVVGVVIQEVSLGTGFWGVLGIGCVASIGGSLLAEVCKMIAIQRDFNIGEVFTGFGTGLAVCGVLLAIFL